VYNETWGSFIADS